MKKTLLISVMLLAGFVGYSQTEPTSLITVKDTSYSNDERLTFLVNTILPAVNSNFENFYARKKVNGEEVLFQTETNTLLQGITSLVYTYAQNFIQVAEVQVDSNSIVQEFNSLNERITILQEDPDIKYLEAMREFQAIQERQAKLAKYYEQLKPVVVSVKAWVQPTGAHDAYAKGAQVSNNGKIWESTIAANVWAPGVSGWKLK